MKNINPINTEAWKELQQHLKKIKQIKLSDLFDNDPYRFSKFSMMFDNQMLIDFSKNHITTETIKKLLNLAKICDVEGSIKAMFMGKKINKTENRAVLHTALRNRKNISIEVNGKNIMNSVNSVLSKMKYFSESVISGRWKGFNGKNITDIVNIGIGGSNLGPYMVTEALRPYKNHLNIHYISNIDATDIIEHLRFLNPETTLFLISSKTFTTQETMMNAHSARHWFIKQAKKEKYISSHFVGISTNEVEPIKFGISKDNIFKFWDWVGGRYSLWSSIGLVIALSLGFNNFEQLLYGAFSMDNHFMNTELEKNIPVILALISIWYTMFFGTETEAVFPYDQYMHLFPDYLQQLNMESNGKSIDRNGKIVQYQTGPIVWGKSGTNGQHSFYQLIHQGTKIVPCDFIAPIISHHQLHDHHVKLLSHFFAQPKALAFGNTYQGVEQELLYSGKTLDEVKKLTPYKVLKGNRPTNSILVRKITPQNLGSLIALYEHKIFVQGIIMNIYSFDQWGVELGKKLAKKIEPDLLNKKILNHDSSTNGLINFYHNTIETH